MFETEGSRSVVCRGGQWSGEWPRCPSADSIASRTSPVVAIVIAVIGGLAFFALLIAGIAVALIKMKRANFVAVVERDQNAGGAASSSNGEIQNTGL